MNMEDRDGKLGKLRFRWRRKNVGVEEGMGAGRLLEHGSLRGARGPKTDCGVLIWLDSCIWFWIWQPCVHI